MSDSTSSSSAGEATAISEVRGAILAGGGATRFGGRPKGLETIGGERILDHLARVLAEALGAPPLLIANDPDAAGWHPGIAAVPDVRPGLGSLGGLFTAVALAPAPVVCIAWDMPFVTPDLVRLLAAGLADADVSIPESGGRRGVEPMCAGYGPACLAAIQQSLDEGDLRAIGFHQRVRVRIIPLDDVRGLGDPSELFFNVNTAEELTAAEVMWRARESSRSSAGKTPARPR